MITLNRGQALAIWSVMSTFGAEVQLRLNEQRRDGEIWGEVSSEYGDQILVFPPSGGSVRAGESPREDASDSKTIEAGGFTGLDRYGDDATADV